MQERVVLVDRKISSSSELLSNSSIVSCLEISCNEDHITVFCGILLRSWCCNAFLWSENRLFSPKNQFQKSRSRFGIVLEGNTDLTQIDVDIWVILEMEPGLVAQSVGHLTRKSGVLGSIPGLATYFRFSFCFFKKGSCQLLAKVCVQRTG